MAPAAGLAPPEGDGPRPVRTLLHQRLVKLAAGPAVDSGPALLAVVLQHTKQKPINNCLKHEIMYRLKGTVQRDYPGKSISPEFHTLRVNLPGVSYSGMSISLGYDTPASP